MNTLQKSALAIIAALGLGLASTAALTAPPWGGGGCPGYGPGGGRGHMMMYGGQRAEWMKQHHDERMELLEYRLNLAPEQREAWEAFKSAQTAHWTSMHGAAQWQQGDQPETFAEHFDRRIEFMEQRLNGMKAMAQAADEFYATLNPEQQAVVDDFFASRPGFGRGSRMGRGFGGQPRQPQDTQQ